MNASKLEPSALVEAARRRAASAPGRLAERFSRVWDRTPDERLERLMRGPARRVILEGIFRQMPRYLDRDRATGVNAAVLWRIAGRANGSTDDYRLQIAQGRARVTRGSSGERPVVTMKISDVDFLRLITGSLDPMQAYFAGKIDVVGDIMFAAKVGGLFRMPMARPDPLA